MSDTWRFIIVVTLLICVGGLLPFAVEESFIPSNPPATAGRGAHG